MKGNLEKTTSIRRRRGAQAVSVVNEGAYGWQAVSPLFCFLDAAKGPCCSCGRTSLPLEGLPFSVYAWKSSGEIFSRKLWNSSISLSDASSLMM